MMIITLRCRWYTSHSTKRCPALFIPRAWQVKRLWETPYLKLMLQYKEHHSPTVYSGISPDCHVCALLL